MLNALARIVNSSDEDVVGLNLRAFIGTIDDEQHEIVDVPAGDAIEVACVLPHQQFWRPRWLAACEACGAQVGKVGEDGKVWLQFRDAAEGV
jgi:uncharacterized protein CbrC (UPF0167 family)